MSEQAAQEPTMEEILASIRRIISEDDAPASEDPAPGAEAAPAPVAAPTVLAEVEEEEDDVLDLTHPMDSREEPAKPMAAAAPSDDIETLGDLDAYIAPAKPAVTSTPIPAPAPREVTASPLLTERAAASVASSFGQLSSALAMPAAGRTLEDVTRELLRPLLKEWLDANLPRIVEAKVSEEVERLARQYR